MNISIYRPIKAIVRMTNKVLDDEIYDMMDQFSREDVVDFTKDIIRGLRRSKSFVYEKNEETDDYFQIKVINQNDGSLVSFSDTEGTGLSQCLTRIFKSAKNPSKEEVNTLLDMINEAYYLCKN